MTHDLSCSQITLDHRQKIQAPTPSNYAAMRTDFFAMSNITHEPELSSRIERRASHQVARSTIESTPDSGISERSSSTCQPTNAMTSTESPQRPSSRAATPRSRSKKFEADANFVKRPLNSFMLYRKDNQHNIPTNNHQSISRIIGDMWRKETAETKNFYDQRAKEERERHLLQHPGYKFQPKKKKKDAKTSRPELKSRQSTTSLYSNGPVVDSVEHDRQEKHHEQTPETDQPLYFGTSQHNSTETVHSTSAAFVAQSTYQHEEEHYEQMRMQQHLPPQYAHYAGQLQYIQPAENTEHQSRHSAGTMLKDPQDWDVLSNQHHYAASAALYPEQAQGSQASIECQWPESYNLLDYNMPATFAEWENTRMPDMPLFQEALQTEVPYYHDQDLEFPALASCDEQDFIPNHMKHNDMLGFAPEELRGSWEIEHEGSHLYQF